MVATPKAVQDALVSFWDAADPRIEHFKGNGVFVAPGWILTAGHVARVKPLYRRCRAEELTAALCLPLPTRLPEPPGGLDVALVKVEMPPTGRTWLDVPANGRSEDELVYACYDAVSGMIVPPTQERPCALLGSHNPTLGTWEFRAHLHKGHSGSGVRLARSPQTLVGIAVARSTDPDVGHMVPIAAIRDWMRECGVEFNPPPDESHLARFAACFDADAFITAGIVDRRGRVPAALENALALGDPKQRALACLRAVPELLRQFVAHSPAGARSGVQGKDIKDRFHLAMGCAVLVCVDPAASPLVNERSPLVHVRAATDVTACALLLKRNCGRFLRAEVEGGVPRSQAGNLWRLPRHELGTLEDALQSMLAEIHHWLIGPAEAASFGSLSSDARRQLLRDHLEGLKEVEQSEHFALSDSPAPEPITEVFTQARILASALDPQLLAWYEKELGLRTAVLDHRPGAFLVAEGVIVSSVGKFLLALAEVFP